MIKRMIVLVMLVCASMTVGAETISSHRSSFPGILKVSFAYEVVDTLPATEQEIVFGMAHTDELLYEKFATFQGRYGVASSTSPAIKKWFDFIGRRMTVVQLSRVKADETMVKFVVSSIDEAFVVGFRLEKQALRSVEQVHALVTIYGCEKDAPGYLLNFLQSCFVEKAMMQKHWGKALVAGFGLAAAVYWKRIPLIAQYKKCLNRLRRRANGHTVAPNAGPAVTYFHQNDTALGPVLAVSTLPTLRALAVVGNNQISDQSFEADMDNGKSLFTRIFELFNVPLRADNSAGEWWDKMTQLHNLLVNYGGIDLLLNHFETVSNDSNKKLRKLFYGTNGIFCRLFAACGTVSLYKRDEQPLVKTMNHRRVGYRWRESGVININETAENFAWTFID
ncbi:hypothetical protein FJ366_00635 [Candidatus Dependentiae bacterium]|nr:hypothetical protein [Candidatus Dependentiae bacterium]